MLTRLVTTLACPLLLASTALASGYSAEQGYGPSPVLPAPDSDHDVRNYSTDVGWPDGAAPRAPEGFAVTRYAEELDSPRWLYVLPNGDVLVAEAATVKGGGSSANRITLLRDADGNGTVDERHVLLQELNQNFGMLLLDGYLYVANTDALLRFPFEVGQTRIEAEGEEILELPAGGYNNHWTRNVVADPEGTKLYVTVGSASNNAEHGLEEEERRANILEIDPDGGSERVFAAGLRNPNGLDWQPESGALWTAVNERDHIGDDLVPDYITSVQEGGFYGWPFAYYGTNEDPRLASQQPDLVEKTLAPDFAVGSHTAALGLVFYRGEAFPERYRNGAFVAQRGSWNRSEFAGYRVLFIPFAKGEPSGQAEDFLTGFLADAETGEAHGRPVGLALDATGALLVADDTGGIVWRVAPAE